MKFSTWDNDNVHCGHNCAAVHGGGWWFSCCSVSNINHDAVTYWSDDPIAPTYDVPVSHMLVKII